MGSVAQLTGLSESTIRRIARSADLELAAERPTVRSPGRPSKTDAFTEFATTEIGRDPAATARQILARARDRGYTGGKSAFYALVAQLRRRSPSTGWGSEPAPGVSALHELRSLRVRYTAGAQAAVLFLVSRLEYSRWLAASVVTTFGIEPVLRALVNHFAEMGGLPLRSTLILPKHMLRQLRNRGTGWDPAFAQAIVDLGIGVEVRATGRTGTRESPARWLKSRWLDRRLFANMMDLKTQLAVWLREINTRIPSLATRVIPGERMQGVERSSLRPLPFEPHDFQIRVPLVVGPGASVAYEGVASKFPAHTVGLLATAHVGLDRVRIVVDGHQSEYERRA